MSKSASIVESKEDKIKRKVIKHERQLSEAIEVANRRYGADNFMSRTLKTIQSEMSCIERPITYVMDFGTKVMIHYHNMRSLGAFIIRVYMDEIELERRWCCDNRYVLDISEIKQKWLKYYDEVPSVDNSLPDGYYRISQDM
jgi:hypothetical protein